MTQAQMAQAVAILSALGIVPNVSAGKAKSFKSAKPMSKADMLADKDAKILASFKKRGFKDTVLLDRANPDKPFNVRPFKGWIAQGRVVRKGQKGVRGLFHVDQTDPIPVAKS